MLGRLLLLALGVTIALADIKADIERLQDEVKA